LITTASTSVPTYQKEGDVVGYSVVVTNTGNVTLKDINVTDAKAFLRFGRTIASLAPGETDSVSTVHIVNTDDIYAGKIETAAIAKGFTVNRKECSSTSEEILVSLVIENYNLSNFPNPFAYETNITFDLPETGEVTLKVFEMSGREVVEIDKQVFYSGRNIVIWKNQDTHQGQYILKLYYNGNQATRIISIVK